MSHRAVRPERASASRSSGGSADRGARGVALAPPAIGVDRIDEGLVQLKRREEPAFQPTTVDGAAARGLSAPATTLPHLAALEQSFGRHGQLLAQVRSYVGGAVEATARALGATAFTRGDVVGFAAPPDLRTAAHEAAHVIQQRGSISQAHGVAAADDPHERHADAVADAVVAGRSAEGLLDQMPAASVHRVQRMPDRPAAPTAAKPPRRETPPLRETPATPDPDEAKLSAIDRLSLGWIRLDASLSSRPLAEIHALQAGLPKRVRTELKSQTSWLTFLAGMMPYFGGRVGPILEHFGKIRPVVGENELYLHDLAANRLEGVLTTLRKAGRVVPWTDVAFVLRDNVTPATPPRGRTYWSHRLGMAIDYRAAKNPQLLDSRLVLALTLLSGRKSAGVQLGPGYTRTIVDMGRKTAASHAAGQADPEAPAPAPQYSEKEQALLDRFVVGYGELATASQQVRAQFGSKETVAAFDDLKRRYLGLGSIADPAKRQEATTSLLLEMQRLLAPLTAKIDEAAEAEAARGNETYVEFPRPIYRVPRLEARLGARPAPWLLASLVAPTSADLEYDGVIEQLLGQHYGAVVGRASVVHGLSLSSVIRGPTAGREALAGWFTAKAGRLAAAGKSTTKALADLAAAARRARPDADAQRQAEQLQVGLAELEREQLVVRRSLAALAGASGANKWYQVLQGLRRDLTGNPRFVLIGKETVADPSLRQVLTRGWINPDADPAPGAEPDRNERGFDPTFMTTMIKFGFDFGVGWGEDALGASEDPQHFQLTEGFASITDAKDQMQRLSTAATSPATAAVTI